MVIIISYNKQTWNEYNDSQTADENLANGAIISADRLNNMETGISNNDTNKVTDNKDGTEQLNGVQVQPYNKLSDTIGGRNLLLGTSSVKVRNPTWHNIINVDVTNLVGTTLTYSAIIDITDSNQGLIEVYLTPQDSSGTSIGDSASSNSINWGNVGKAIATITIPAGASNLSIIERTNNTDQNPLVGSRKLEKGSIATDWTPAPEDKVNVSDTSNWQKQAMFNPGDYLIDITSSTTDFATLLRTKYNTGGIVYIRDDNGPSYAGVVDAVVICEGNGWWYAYGVTIDGNFAHRRITTGDDTGWVLNADDSKVAHLSGTNNFDTVPTVNNNNLAIDSKVAHLSGANNFDTVPTYGTNNKPFAINDTGATTARPTGQAVGYQYFDTTLNKPIWYNGANWVDSTGTTV